VKNQLSGEPMKYVPALAMLALSLFPLGCSQPVQQTGNQIRIDESGKIVLPDDAWLVGASSRRNGDLDIAERAVASVVQRDWETLDRSGGTASDMTGSDRPVHWHKEISLPFPTHWPPRRDRSITYYVFAQYQLIFMHGPSLSDSAPWAKVVLEEGREPRRILLSKAVGEAVGGRASQPISAEKAKRLAEIHDEGRTQAAKLLEWRSMPDANDRSSRAIRDLYCQWQIEHRGLVDRYIRPNHKEFFDWLSCPTLTWADRGVLP
jgi:hypothetical protein